MAVLIKMRGKNVYIIKDSKPIFMSEGKITSN